MCALLRLLVTVLVPVRAFVPLNSFDNWPGRALSTAVANFLLEITGLVLGIDLFFRGFRLLQRKQLIEGTPRSTVRGAAIGQVEVYGRIVGPYTLISPLTETECYMYAASLWGVEEGKRSQSKRLADETLAVPFFVEDETGRMMVDPRGAELQMQTAVVECSGAMPEHIRRFVGRHVGQMAIGAKAMESCVKPGDVLFVLGHVRENPAHVQPDSLAALQFDEFFLSPEAAALQRRCALEDMHVPLPEKDQPQAVPVGFDLNPAKVLGKGHGQLFFISQESGREVVSELAWKSMLFIWGGPVMALLSVGFFCHSAGWL